MLNAWARGKRGRARQEYEDEIISSIFGRLMYFPCAVRTKVIATLLRGLFDPELFRWMDESCTCDILLWPNIAESGRTEPDVVFHVKGDKLNWLSVILEAKWNAGLSQNQLQIQRSACERKFPGRKVLQIYLTKRPQSYEEMGVRTNTGQQENLRNLTWSRLAHLLQSAAKTPEYTSWAVTLQAFLASLGEDLFDGVSAAVKRVAPNPATDLASTWHFDAFSGFYGCLHWVDCPKHFRSEGDAWVFDGGG